MAAEFIPIKDQDWSDTTKTWSSFCYKAPIIITRPSFATPIVNLTEVMNRKVGGLLGFGSTEFTATIIFPKNEFYIGEKLIVRIMCDNTHCYKDVRAFKVKLNYL